MVTYAVVGASRGIGLEFVLQLAARPNAVVFAIARNVDKAVHLNAAVAGLKNVHIVEGDVIDHASLERTAKQVGSITGGTLDCLIHNAAKMGGPSVFKDFGSFNASMMDELDTEYLDSFKANVLGVVHSIHAFYPLLRAGPTKQIVVIASEVGTASFIRAAGLAEGATYGMSKAASLLTVTKYALKLAPEGFTVVNLSPGLVDTSGTAAVGEGPDPARHARMGLIVGHFASMGQKAVMQTPAQSVKLQLEAIDGLTKEQNGLMLSPTAEVCLPGMTAAVLG